MELNLVAPINQLGYGVASLNILNTLYKQGHEVTLWPIGPVDAPTETHGVLRHCVKKQDNYNDDAPTLKIWHQFDLADSIGRGPRTAFPFFELDKLTPREAHHLKSLDKVFVASKWAADILSAYNIKGSVAPLGVDRDIFNEHIKPAEFYNSEATIFFSCGKWEIRKGHDVILKAFNAAFKSSDNVHLIMQCFNPFLPMEENIKWTDMFGNSKLGSKITVPLTRYSSQIELAKLMSSADCGVFPSRAEGWNLELLEMMACGKQVIATNYSAHTEFINEKNCNIINIEKLEPAYDGVFFKNKNADAGNWAAFGSSQMQVLIEHMRRVHALKQERGRAALFNSPGVSTSKAFSWENTCNKICGGLLEL